MEAQGGEPQQATQQEHSILETVNEQVASLLKRLEASGHTTFWGTLGCELLSCVEGRAVVTLKIEEKHLNYLGLLHGGVHASLADSAMGLAVMSLRPAEQVVTTNLNMQYLASVKQERVTITAEVLQAGRTMATACASLHDHRGRLCAYSTATFRLLGPI